MREEIHTVSGEPSPIKGPDIARQVVLPFRKSLEISMKSLRVRFFRSLITTITLVLAVAFLGFVWVSTDLADGLLRTRDPGVLQALERVGYDVGPGSTSAGSSAKDRWIVALSLLVCVVGIVNAQIMAVTERTPTRIKTLLTDQADNARLSRRLATIDTQSPVEFHPESYRIKPPHDEQLAELLRELEFTSLLKSLQPSPKQPETERPRRRS